MAAGRAAAFSLTRHPLTPRILSSVLSRGPILAVGSGPVHFRFTPFRSCSGNSNDCSSAVKSRRRKFGHWSLDSFALWSGVDYEHWFVGMDKPGGEGATKQQMIDCYVKTLAQVVGSEEEAKKKIYRVRCDPKKQQLGFCCKADWNARYKLQELPGVVGTLPECDPNDEERGGELFVTNVTEETCASEYRLFGNAQLSDEKDQNFSPKYNLFVQCHCPIQRIPYFITLSTEEDENFSPKYGISRPLPLQNGFDFTGDCNGLLCFDDKEGNIVLWNLLTYECKFLPQSLVERPPGAINTFIYSGLGFDRKSKDYKVIRFIMISFEDEEKNFLGGYQLIELYSLKSDSWKKISYAEYFASEVPSICINGIYYCRAVKEGESGYLILLFDFSNEKLSTLPLPDIKKSQVYNFLEYKGLFSIIVYSMHGIEKSLELWVMNGSWTRESVFHTSGVERPLGFWKNGQLLFLESLDHELLLFDRATGKLKNLDIHSSPGAMELISFIESFVQLNGGSEFEGCNSKSTIGGQNSRLRSGVLAGGVLFIFYFSLLYLFFNLD